MNFCLSQLSQNHKLAVAVSREQVQSTYRSTTCQLHCFTNAEIIYDYALKFLVNKNFPYLNQLNEFIKTASEAGLIEKWQSKGSSQSYVEQGADPYDQLTMGNLYAFNICICIIWIGIILLFSFEILVHKQVRKPNASRVWRLVEMAIDPDRHVFTGNKMAQ